MEIQSFKISPYRYYVFVAGPLYKCELRAEIFAEDQYQAIGYAMEHLRKNPPSSALQIFSQKFLEANLPENLEEELLRYSAGDDLLAAKIAQETGVPLEKACALRDAFLAQGD